MLKQIQFFVSSRMITTSRTPTQTVREKKLGRGGSLISALAGTYFVGQFVGWT